MCDNNLVYGIDFGTSNSAIAVFKDGKVEVLPIGKENKKTISSVLFFSDKDRRSYVGEEAIYQYIKSGMKGRFLQSIKSVLPDISFDGTVITGQYYTIDKLIALILSYLKEKADRIVGQNVKSVVMGRPAFFSNKKEEDRVAEERLLKAAKLAGFENVSFQIEPIAAALYYELSLTKPEIALVADFGGGTSDFTIMRLSPDKINKKNRQKDIIATSGIHIAGDDFDSEIMRERMLKYFGANAKYKTMTSWMRVPTRYTHTICEWEKTFTLKNPRDREFVQQMFLSTNDQESIRRLQSLINNDLCFSLFQSINGAKCNLSHMSSSKVSFHQLSIDIEEIISRNEFNTIITEKVSYIKQCLMALLKESDLSVSDIDSVFITGGTSFVPLIRSLLSDTLGQNKIKSGDAFVSVASGLALS